VRVFGWLRNFSFKDMNPMVLGIALIVITGAVVGGVFAVGSLGLLKHRYQMSGVFPETAGLRNGDLVRVAGVDVGVISGVKPDFAHGNVIVSWKVDHGVELGPRTTAEISLATLLGGKYLKLGGPVERPYLESLPRAQRRIPLARAKLPATIDQVLNTTTHLVENLDVTSVNRLVGQLGDLTADNTNTVGQLAADLASVSAAVNARQQQLAQLVGNAQQITATLATKDKSLAQLVDNASALLDVIVKRRDELGTLLGSGSQVVTTLSNLIANHRAQLDAIIDDLHATLTVTDRHQSELNTQLAFLGPTFTGLASTTRAGPWIDAVAFGLGPTDVNVIGQFLKGTPKP
jgi:phospholipid/cholesterol/gamma-HCH transport system substrate-binding protein